MIGLVVAYSGYQIQRRNRERAAHLALYDIYARLTTGEIAKARHDLYIIHLSGNTARYDEDGAVACYFVLLWALPFIVEAMDANDLWDKAKGVLDYHAKMVDAAIQRIPSTPMTAAPDARAQYKVAHDRLIKAGWFRAGPRAEPIA
ncbi:hypothetical protein [Mycobacterium sp. RTGN5]|uniref:hypothetical protein n=1 Tax=Mycobacterium sp. RTGN5 TaxID=3016522 RepID=UPI0029C6B9D9|nr:hypothetical protein [Mycobacterium sp. RTGN5]